MRASTAPDDIAVLERAYELHGSTEAWLDGLHQALKPRLDYGHGLLLSTWRVRDGRFGTDSIARGDIDPRIIAGQYEFAAALPPEFVAQHYGPAASDFIAQPSQFPPLHEALMSAVERQGVEASPTRSAW